MILNVWYLKHKYNYCPYYKCVFPFSGIQKHVSMHTSKQRKQLIFTIDRCLFCGARLESHHLDITSSSQTNKILVKSASDFFWILLSDACEQLNFSSIPIIFPKRERWQCCLSRIWAKQKFCLLEHFSYQMSFLHNTHVCLAFSPFYTKTIIISKACTCLEIR